MQGLRKLLAGACWPLAIVFGLVSFTSTPSILRRAFMASGHHGALELLGLGPLAVVSLARVLLFVLALTPLAIALSSGMAALRFRQGKPSARPWAIGCACSLLVVSLLAFVAAGIALFFPGGGKMAFLLEMMILPAGLGIFAVLMLVAFAPRNSMEQTVAAPRPQRIKGDGTSRFSLVIIIAVSWACFHWGDRIAYNWAFHSGLHWHRDSLLLSQAGFVLVLFLSALIHELGHLAGGKLSGMKLYHFQAGPLQLEAEDGRLRLIKPSSWKSLLCGSIAMAPGDPSRFNRLGEIVMVAGGPAANLLTGVAALALMANARGAFYEPVWWLLESLGTMSIALFVGNLIPVQSPFYSDGARIYQVLTHSPLADYHWIASMANLNAVSRLGVKEYNIELVERALATEAAYLDRMFLNLVAADYLIANDRLEEARTAIRRAESLETENRWQVRERCEDFVFYAFFPMDDLAMARKWWERSRQFASCRKWKRPDRITECAYLTMEGRTQQAWAIWHEERARVLACPETCQRSLRLKTLEQIRQRLEEMRLADGTFAGPESARQPAAVEVAPLLAIPAPV